MNKPENERNEAISMTAPVSMKSTENKDSYSMRFFLPKKYGNANEAPKPSSNNVKVVDVEPRVVAVRTFSGKFKRNNIYCHKELLLSSLKEDEIAVKDTKLIEVFGYNPPWTLNAFRTNEVLVPVEY